MRPTLRALALALLFSTAVACNCAPPPPVDDAGTDAGPTPVDAGPDAGPGEDGGADAGPDGGPDGGADGGPDGGPDAGADGGCGPCASGVCQSDGGCAQCATDQHCSGATPRCDTPTNTCVECLATNDNCDAGFWCGPAQTCVQGCRADSECSSGTCLPSHDCATCQSSSECSAGKQCSTGLCLPGCMGSSECDQDAGFTCCGGRCADTRRDLAHCGACNAACTANQFCSGTGCVANQLANICAVPAVTVLLNGLSADDDAGTSMGAALVSGCSSAPTVRVLPQEDAGGVLNPVTGQPLTFGGEVLVAAGGSFRQRLVDYLERAGLTAVVDVSDEADAGFARRDGGSIAGGPAASLSDGHDYFVIELVRTPSGSLNLVAYGFYAPGTRAAAWYFVNHVVPQRASLTQSWYVLEWTDSADGGTTGLPDLNDTWTVLGSGS